jgi:hypothetical protein
MGRILYARFHVPNSLKACQLRLFPQDFLCEPLSSCSSADFQNVGINLPVQRQMMGENMTFPAILGNRYLRTPAPARELPLARPVNLKQALHIFRECRISWKPFSRRQNTLIQSDPSFQPLIFASRSLHSPQPSPGKKYILVSVSTRTACLSAESVCTKVKG